MQYLNEAHPTIKFTYESSTNSVNFLDLTIYKGSRHMTSLVLDIKPFFKDTNKFQYLEYSSAHPRNTFASLVKGELTRLLRACSNEETYRQVADKILEAFKDRGYPKDVLQRTLQLVPFQNRSNLLKGEKEDGQKYDTFLKVNYTPDLDTKSLRTTLKLAADEEGVIPNPCLSLTKTDNLAKKLVRAKLRQYPNPPTSITIRATKQQKEGNSMPCETPGCKCCTAISKKCRVIGQTSESLKTRLAQHITNSTVKTNFPLYKHFLQKADHHFENDTRVTILQTTTRNRLLEAENTWIQSMDTTSPNGLNTKYHN